MMDQPETKEHESPEMPESEKRESRRSMVRVYVTYARRHIPVRRRGNLIATLFFHGKADEAKDLFLAIMPVSAAVISYWFATAGRFSAGSGG